MKRGNSGRYEVSTSSGEPVRAFVPSPLPELREQQAEAARLDSAIATNLEALGYGG